MKTMTEYIYVFFWALLALLCFVIAFKEKKLYALAPALVLAFMSVWYGLRAFAGIAVFSGTLGIIYRVVLGVFLALCIVFYVISRIRNKK